jgi:hypothetical protein
MGLSSPHITALVLIEKSNWFHLRQVFANQ